MPIEMSKIIPGFYSFKPSAPLDKYIDIVWYCYHENVSKICLALPLSHFELVINLTSEYKLYDGLTKRVLLNNAEGWISGLHHKPFIKQLEGVNENIGVVFKRYGIAHFTDVEPREFENSFVSVTDLWKYEISFIREQIQEAKSINRKVFLLETFLKNKLDQHTVSNADILTYNILDEIAKGAITKKKVYDICNEFKITRKTLNKYLVKRIGSSASKYKRLVIFNHVIKSMNCSPNIKLTELAYDYNYFDQAHFIKDFSSLAGMTPREFAKNVSAKKVDTKFANYLILSV